MQNNTDKLKLLELTRSESDTDSPQFSIPKRKVRFKKRFRPNSKPKSTTEVSESCSCQCVQHARLVLNIVLFIVVAILIWFITNLNTKVEGLQKLLNDLETGNKKTPEEFHDIHNGLQMLGHNVTSLGLELNKVSGKIQAISAEVKAIQQTTEHLRASIAAAPEIKDLPNTVHSLTENLANIGSKITVVESDVKQMKLQHDSFTASVNTIENEIANVKINESIKEDLLKHVGGVTMNDVMKCNTELEQLKASIEKLKMGFDHLHQTDNVTAFRINNLQKSLQQLLQGKREESIDSSNPTYQEMNNMTGS